MTMWMNQKYADAIGREVNDVKASLGPQLCCEVQGGDAGVLVRKVVELVGAWQRKLVGCFVYRGAVWRLCVVSLNELSQLLEKAVANEEVISILDLTLPGGCSVDFTPESDEKVEMLITSWGQHEGTTEKFAQDLGNLEMFRGN